MAANEIGRVSSVECQIEKENTNKVCCGINCECFTAVELLETLKRKNKGQYHENILTLALEELDWNEEKTSNILQLSIQHNAVK